MFESQLKRNRVRLTDYGYKDDIAKRLFLANSTCLDLQVLRELISHAPHVDLNEIQESLNLDLKAIRPVLDKLEQTGLFKRMNGGMIVDKALRKYYEAQLIRFDSESTPGFDSLFTQLRCLPIHVLPNWYSIPRGSTDIMQSIVEQHVQTPKIYERYLAELTFEDPTAQAIMEAVLATPHGQIDADELQTNHRLTNEAFQEILLGLEWSFVCCLRFVPFHDHWKGIVSQYREWRDYLLFRRETGPKSLSQQPKVSEFRFVKDLSALVRAVQEAPLTINTLHDWLPEMGLDPDYLNALVARLHELDIAILVQDRLMPTTESGSWLQKSLQEQAMLLYRLPIEGNERTMHEIERQLRSIFDKGWIDFQEFVQSLLVPIGAMPSVMLKQSGRQWRYEIPKYGSEEIAYLKMVILQRLFESGMVDVRQDQNRECFCVTPFGRLVLG